MSANASVWPSLTLPEAEADYLRTAYQEARCILEYGSGGSTVLAAQQAGKLVFSVESDRQWALSMQRQFDEADLLSPVIVYHVDIGETGAWGRAKDDTAWRHFYRYPTAIWSENFFRQPDLILIDGRFRAACFVNACLRTRAPVTILFDDYRDRNTYHSVERLMKPTKIVGRMAIFHVEPQEWPQWTVDLLLELCTHVTFSADKVNYDHVPELPFINT
jgi:hypothetical protein